MMKNSAHRASQSTIKLLSFVHIPSLSLSQSTSNSYSSTVNPTKDKPLSNKNNTINYDIDIDKQKIDNKNHHVSSLSSIFDQVSSEDSAPAKFLNNTITKTEADQKPVSDAITERINKFKAQKIEKPIDFVDQKPKKSITARVYYETKTFKVNSRLEELNSKSDFRNCWALYLAMKKKDVPRNIDTYNILLKIADRTKDTEKLIEVINDLKYNHDITVSTRMFNSLLKLLKERKCNDQAIELFHQMKDLSLLEIVKQEDEEEAREIDDEVLKVIKVKPDQISYSLVLQMHNGRWYKSLLLFKEFRSLAKVDPTVRLDSQMYTIVMNNCVKSKEYDIVLDMFQEMKAMGLPLGVVTYTTVLPAVRAGQKAIDLLVEMKNLEIKPNAVFYIKLVSILAKNRTDYKNYRYKYSPRYQEISDLYKKNRFNKDFDPNSVDRENIIQVLQQEVFEDPQNFVLDATYPTFISAYGKQGYIKEAEKLYAQMQDENVMPDLATYNTLINMFVKQKRFSEAFSFIQELKKHGMRPDIQTYTPLLDMALQQKEDQLAEDLLEEMKEEDISLDRVAYEQLAKHLIAQEKMTKVLELFEEMRGNDVKVSKHLKFFIKRKEKEISVRRQPHVDRKRRIADRLEAKRHPHGFKAPRNYNYEDNNDEGDALNDDIHNPYGDSNRIRNRKYVNPPSKSYSIQGYAEESTEIPRSKRKPYLNSGRG